MPDFVLNNWDALLGILAGILSIVWTFIKGTDWWQRYKDKKAVKVTQALLDVAKVAVIRTYNEKVRHVKQEMAKAGRPKFTPEEIDTIQAYALTVLKDEAKQLPSQIAKIVLGLSDGKLKAVIEEQHKEVKAAGLAAKNLAAFVSTTVTEADDNE